MISALDVAWYFVQKGNGDPSITQLKLQKLCYYAQGYYLAVVGKPLFYEAIEAWKHGPLVEPLWRVLENKGAETIYPSEPAFGNSLADLAVTDSLDKVWACFGHYSAGKLVQMTHSEAPWKETYKVGQNKRISEDLMLSYFTDLLIKPNDNDSIDSNCFITINFKDGSQHKVSLDEAPCFVQTYRDEIATYKRERKGSARVVGV